MADVVRTLLARLSAEATARLVAHVGLAPPGIEALTPRHRTKLVFDAVVAADDEIRGRVEGIAGNVVDLARRQEHAERAMRAACEGTPALLELLEEERSLEERILLAWLTDASVLDRARNLAMGFHWRDGRYHCGFRVLNAGGLNPNAEAAMESIGSIVQSRQGGRKVHTETFEYVDPDDESAATDGPPHRIHHIAVLLEQPARYLMEFKPDDVAATPVLRREAREMSIDFDPQSGRLDVAGKGLGGARVLQEVADAFRVSAIEGAEITQLVRPTWALDRFLTDDPPSLLPPESFTGVLVSEMELRSQGANGGMASFQGGEDQTAFDRMRELNVSPGRLTLELVRSVTFTFEAVPETQDAPRRRVRATARWPNAISYDGAGVRDLRAIDAWLEANLRSSQESDG